MTDNVENISEWQFCRIRTRLLAYFYSEKIQRERAYQKRKNILANAKLENTQKEIDNKFSDHPKTNISVLSLTFDILVFNEDIYEDLELTEEEKEDLDSENYQTEHKVDNSKIDTSWPLKQEALRRMLFGYDRDKKSDETQYRSYSRPMAPTPLAIKKFLMNVGFLQEKDLIEPFVWPEPEKSVQLEWEQSRSAFLNEKVMKAFEGDFRGEFTAPEEPREELLSFGLKANKKWFKVRLLFNQCRKIFNKPNLQWNTREWDYYSEQRGVMWGWMLISNTDFGIIYLEDKEMLFNSKIQYNLKETINTEYTYQNAKQVVIQEFVLEDSDGFSNLSGSLLNFERNIESNLTERMGLNRIVKDKYFAFISVVGSADGSTFVDDNIRGGECPVA